MASLLQHKPASPERVRGGWRQRQAACEAQSRSRSPERVHSGRHLLRRWLLDFAWGDLSAAKVGQYCAAGQADGLTHPALLKLARTAAGASSHNVHRQLLLLFGTDDCSELVESIPDSQVDSFVFPHDVIALLARKFPLEFKLHLGADVPRLKVFWTGFRSSAAGRDFINNHPHLRGRSDLDHVVPILVHADGAPVAKKTKVVLLQWASLIGLGSDKETLFPCCTWIPISGKPNEGWAWLGHDLETLSSGIFPSHSPCGAAYAIGSRRGNLAGRPFAPDGPDGEANFSFVFMFMTGDLEMMTNELGLPSYSSNEPCFYCGCNRSTIPWTDFKWGALWREHVHEDIAFLARVRNRGASAFWTWAGATRDSICLDTLHLLDHHGVGSAILGNLFAQVIRDRELPRCRNREEGLAELNARISAHQTTYGVQHRVPPLTWENIVATAADSYPELHGPAIKAATTKGLFSFAASLARELDDGTKPKSHRRILCEKLLEMSDMIDHGPSFFPTDLCEKFLQAAHKVQVNYSWLAQHAMQHGQCYYKVVPKLHLLGHLPQQSQLVNPRLVRCYRQESAIGKVQRIYKRSLSGPFHNTVQRNVLRKFWLGVQLQFAD